jgi:hypothetical protein
MEDPYAKDVDYELSPIRSSTFNSVEDLLEICQRPSSTLQASLDPSVENIFSPFARERLLIDLGMSYRSYGVDENDYPRIYGADFPQTNTFEL